MCINPDVIIICKYNSLLHITIILYRKSIDHIEEYYKSWTLYYKTQL